MGSEECVAALGGYFVCCDGMKKARSGLSNFGPSEIWCVCVCVSV